MSAPTREQVAALVDDLRRRAASARADEAACAAAGAHDQSAYWAGHADAYADSAGDLAEVLVGMWSA